ncbi:MAG: AGE family epimerase/isomerase [Bradymonadales bacterium]|nr:AGE family epimerase/isomerase [Bradymonadales bacterium]
MEPDMLDAEDAQSARLEALWSFYAQLQEDAWQFGYSQGDWTEDYGDAPFYGLGFYIRAGRAYDRDDYLSVAEEARVYNLDLVEQALASLSWYTDHFEEVVMAALGLCEYADATEDPGPFLDRLDQLIDNTNDLLTLFSDYLDVELGDYAIATYGPTTISAAAALLNLQYAYTIDNQRSQQRIERAAAIVRSIDENALDGQRYLFRPGDQKLYLYPNTMMMLVLCRLYELTDNRTYLEVAQGIFQAIQPLKDPQHGYYRSPYSAQTMGAQTEDYSTLSSQNYLAMALLVLYQDTGDAAYLSEAISVLDVIRRTFYDLEQGRLLHHVMDGRIALPTDPEYFCSGCNLQTLYILWYLKEEVLADPPAGS